MTTSNKMQTVLNELIQIETRQNLAKMYRNDDFTTYSKEEIENEFKRREDLKPKPLTIEQQLAFICANNPEHEKYKIEEVFQSCFDKALSKLSTFHFSKGTNYIFTKYRVVYTNTLEMEVKRFAEYLLTQDISLEDFAMYEAHNRTFGTYHLRPDSGNTVDRFVGGSDATTLCHFIQYLATGQISDNYEVTNNFMKEHNISYNAGAYNYTIGHITVKKFANGRLDIKGLTAADCKKIDTCTEIQGKVQRS